MFPFSLGVFSHWTLASFLGFVFLVRYIRLYGNLAAKWLYRPIQPPENPTYTAKDVTAIIPTIGKNTEQLLETVQTIYALEPAEIFLVVPEAGVKPVEAMVERLHCSKRIRMLKTKRANKRRQLCRAIPEVTTPITLLLDDDVWLPAKFMEWVLAPFEDRRVGGVGTNQIVRRFNRWNFWEFLGAIYLVRRNFDCTACNYWDGGLPCLSGRAVAYRSEILQDRNFTSGFASETWKNCVLNADDDNFITRWLFSHEWEIRIQNHPDCEVETVLETNSEYYSQCLRWVRSNWRSNLTTLGEGHMWRKYPWSMYAVFQTTVTQWTLLIDIFLFWGFRKTLRDAGYYGESADDDLAWQRNLLWSMFFGHMFVAKTIKLVPHLLRNPGDVFYVPVSILFGFCHNFIKLHGAFTLKQTTWGTRQGAADVDNKFRMQPREEKDLILTPPMTPAMTPSPQSILRERGPTQSTALA